MDYWIVYAYDHYYPNQAAALAANSYWGSSGEFTMTPGSYNVPLSTGGGSTWPAGPIQLNPPIPEPGTSALLGLGALLVLRPKGR